MYKLYTSYLKLCLLRIGILIKNCCLSLKVLCIQNLVKIGPADFEKKMIKDDAPGTTNDDGGQPIALVT